MNLTIRFSDNTTETINLQELTGNTPSQQVNSTSNVQTSIPKPQDTTINKPLQSNGLLFNDKDLAKLNNTNMPDSNGLLFKNKDLAKLTGADVKSPDILGDIKELIGVSAIENTINDVNKLRDEYVDIDTITRQKITAEKANNANTIGQLLDTIWFKTTGNKEALDELNYIRQEQSKKIVDTLARLNPKVQIQARETNGIIEYFAKEGNKWRKLDYEWYKEFANNLDDSKTELVLGVAGGGVGAYYGKQAGNILSGAFEAWAGSKLKKAGKAGKYASKAIGEGIKWGATGIGTTIGSMLGTGSGAVADTLFAQQELGEALDYATAIQSGKEAAVYSAVLSAMAKPVFQTVGLGVKGISELTNHIVLGNINGARAALRAKTNLTEEQITQLTNEFTSIYGKTQGITKAADEVFVMGLRPENLPILEKAGKLGTSEGALKFVSGVGEEFVKEANSKINREGLKDAQDYLKLNKDNFSNLTKTPLYKQLVKGNINVDTMAKSLVDNVGAFDESYSRIINVLPKDLKADLENLVVAHTINKNSKMIDNFYAVNFSKIANELDKFKLSTHDAKVFHNTIKGSAKYIDNSYNLIPKLNAIPITPGSGIGTSIVSRFKTFGVNTMFKTFSIILGDNIAAAFHLGKMLDKPMEAKTYKDLAKALNMPEDEVLETTKQFRDTYYRATKGGSKQAGDDINTVNSTNVSSATASTQDNIINDTSKYEVGFPNNTSVITTTPPNTNAKPVNNPDLPNQPVANLQTQYDDLSINTDNSSRQILDDILKEKGAQYNINDTLDSIKRYLNPRAKKIIESLGSNKLGDINNIVKADIDLLKNIVSNKTGVVLDGFEANILLYKILTEIANDNIDDVALEAQTKAFPNGIKYK